MRRLSIAVISMLAGITMLRPRRFIVTDRSMEPTLVDGQGLIAVCWPLVRPGQLRCVEHPDRIGFWLVKRVASVSGDQMFIISDNTAVDAVDSRRFGSVPARSSSLVVIRVPKRWM